MSFSNLGLTPALCTVLDRLGYQTPTPVQLQAIPLVLSGKDVVARAPADVDAVGSGHAALADQESLEALEMFGAEAARRVAHDAETGEAQPPGEEAHEC